MTMPELEKDLLMRMMTAGKHRDMFVTETLENQSVVHEHVYQVGRAWEAIHDCFQQAFYLAL